MKKNKIAIFFNRYINGTKGVISLFLAILMVPFASIAGMLINAGRINSAVAIFDEALRNASNSTLGTYDSFIRSRFALMAISQDTSVHPTQTGYGADDFLNELFCYYMAQNLGTLSNTYQNIETTAEGLYPLADPEILRSSIIQSGKIVLPAKLISDFGSIDDLLEKLTKPFDIIAKFEDLVAGGADVVGDIKTLTDNQEALQSSIDDCGTKKSEYTTAYNSFVTSATNFNSLIDSISHWRSKVSQCQAQVNTCRAKVGSSGKSVASMETTIDSLKKEINELNREKTSGYKDEVKDLEKEIEELEDEIDSTAPDYDDAKRNLSNAKNNLQSYINDFPNKKTAAENAKSNYIAKIIAFRDAVETTGDKLIEFQNSAKSLVNDGLGLVGDTVSAGTALKKEIHENQLEQLDEQDQYYSYQKTLADNDGYTKESTHYYDLLQENESLRQNLNNEDIFTGDIDKVVGGAETAFKESTSEITEFANRKYQDQFKSIYNNLETIRINVQAITVPSSNTTKLSYQGYIYDGSLTIPVSGADISLLIENIEAQVETEGGWDILKVIVDFLDALMNISLNIFFDGDLDANINTALYSDIGGLPSYKASIGKYPLVAPHDAEDAARALENKKLLNSYADVEIYPVSESKLSDFDIIISSISTLKSNLSPFKLKNLPTIFNAASSLVQAIIRLGASFASQGAQAILNSLKDKLYITTYSVYNTANRTTYKGSALTGAKYGVPLNSELGEGYAFCGAETEYIFMGDLDEKSNQTRTASAMLATRLLINIMPVLGDATIQTIATTLGSFTFGIGTVITYVLVIVAESYADMMLLCGGSEVPLVKTYVFLSPTGILKFIKKAINLDFSEDIKKSIYEKSCNTANSINSKSQDFALEHFDKYVGEDDMTFSRYDDYKKESDAQGNSITSIYELNYTKNLWILMVLFGNTDKMVTRIADIIQMEATYKALHEGVSEYKFNLDKSYTYLRTAGDFTSKAFIGIGSTDTLTSNERVIYNGY